MPSGGSRPGAGRKLGSVARKSKQSKKNQNDEKSFQRDEAKRAARLEADIARDKQLDAKPPKQQPVRKNGRPGSFRPEDIKLVYRYALLGATEAEMAEAFGITEVTLWRWRQQYPDFRKAHLKGRLEADAKVAKALHKRATGFEHTAVKIFNEKGTPMVVPYQEYYPPDTGAATYWLGNRQPQWREKKHIVVERPYTELNEEERMAWALDLVMRARRLVELEDRTIEHEAVSDEAEPGDV